MTEGKEAKGRARRPRPASVGRIIATGVSASATLGLVATMALDQDADSDPAADSPPDSIELSTAAPTGSATTSAVVSGSRPIIVVRRIHLDPAGSSDAGTIDGGSGAASGQSIVVSSGSSTAGVAPTPAPEPVTYAAPAPSSSPDASSEAS